MLALVAMMPFLVGLGPASLIESDAGRAPVTEAVIRQLPASAPPTVRSRAGILVDQATGQTIWERDPDARLAMASTAKMMTVLLAVERGRLDQPVRVRMGAAELPGSSVAGLKAGDTLPMSEMLYALMLPSGNDAALAIAEAIGGTTATFVAQMNQRATELGLRNTRFANPHGLDTPDAYASPRDLALLARRLLEHPTLAQVVATREHAPWKNTNTLLTLRPDVTGIKTGTEDLAGQVLVASARQAERRAISVVMNSPERWVESAALLDHYFKAHALVTVAVPASPFYRGLRAAPSRSETVPLWQAGLLSAQVGLAGDEAVLDVELAGRRLGTVPLGRP